jgi:hypothetical protein
MGGQNERHLMRGVVAGVAGGLVASWVMNVFMEQAGPKIAEAAAEVMGDQEPDAGKQRSEPSAEGEEPKQDATMKAADAIVSTVSGGRHLSMEERQKGGPVVHYAFGALMGGLYGAVAEYSTSARSAFGTTFGSTLFVGADLVAVPAFNLSGSPREAPPSTLATPFAAHLVYGAITEGVRRLVRAIL